MLFHKIAVRGKARALVHTRCLTGSCVFRRHDALRYEDLARWVAASYADLQLLLMLMLVLLLELLLLLLLLLMLLLDAEGLI